MNFRIEKDTMGEVNVPADKYWGAQTERSRNNFKIGPEGSMPIEIIRAFAILKKCAAKANLQPGLAQATVTAPLTGAGPVHVGLVAYLSGDVDGSYAGATGASDLDMTEPNYFVTLVANHPGVLSAAQFGN